MHMALDEILNDLENLFVHCSRQFWVNKLRKLRVDLQTKPKETLFYLATSVDMWGGSGSLCDTHFCGSIWDVFEDFDYVNRGLIRIELFLIQILREKGFGPSYCSSLEGKLLLWHHNPPILLPKPP